MGVLRFESLFFQFRFQNEGAIGHDLLPGPQAIEYFNRSRRTNTDVNFPSLEVAVALLDKEYSLTSLAQEGRWRND